MIGQSIAHYEITAKLGEGAMGEVYRATDTRLNRSVAIKMLSRRFAGDPGLVSRMQREAEVLASLSHAHIGQIYGIENAGDSKALVLEYVGGPTLADRMEQGPLPLERALRIAHQIAGALESAHERGIIHRDLKPANVKLTAEGDAKVLDFGLAKGIHVDAAKTGLTAEGVVVGTPSYMSPEQVEGQELDRRTDIWSFGCVLFEMLAGRKAFCSQSIGSLFAAIGVQEIDLDLLADAPASVRRLVERCLRKHPHTRLRDIGDARVEIEDLLSGRVEPAPAEVSGPRPRRTGVLVPAAIALALVAGTLLGWTLSPSPAEATRTIARYSIAMPAQPSGLHIDGPSGAPPLAISRDGQAIVFAARDSAGDRWLYLRRAQDRFPRKLPGTKGTEAPFFSPDGNQVGFLLHGADHLHRISLKDGTVHKIVETDVLNSASWGGDGTLVLGIVSRGLGQVPASGGEITPLTEPAENEFDHRWPQSLPDGDVLFTASLRDGRLEPRLLSRKTGEITIIPVQGRFAHYLSAGYLVFAKSNELWAVRFDLAARKVIGGPARVVTGIHESVLGTPHFAVSVNGVLVYEPFRPPSAGRGLVWVDRQGNSKPLTTAGRGYEFPRLSPDQRKVLVAMHLPTGTHDIRAIDVERRTETKITDIGNFIEPVWSPEGDTIAFSSFGERNLFMHRPGDLSPERLLGRPGQQFADGWTKNGRLLFTEQTAERGGDVLELDLESKSVQPLVATSHNEFAGTVSPGGRWLAYVSDETGRCEVYLRSYPDPGSKERVSVNGGSEPVWSPPGGELFFRSGRDYFVVEIREDAGRPIGASRKLFDGSYVEGFHSRPNYDVSADGQRFVMVKGELGLTQGRLDVHLGFGRELERALPGRE